MREDLPSLLPLDLAPPFKDLSREISSSLRDTRGGAKILDCARTRLLLLGVAFFLIFLSITGRLIFLMAFPNELDSHQNLTLLPAPHRADILDRNGNLLATNLMVSSLFINPQEVLNPEEIVEKLQPLLFQKIPLDLAQRIRQWKLEGKQFVWIARALPPALEAAILKLGLPGLQFETEARRLYPYGSLLVHVIGYTDIDGNGMAGIERNFDTDLRRGDSPIRLSIDLRVQQVLHDVLQKNMEEFRAEGAVGIILDVWTGEILGLLSLPDFDPNGKKDNPLALFNKATLGVYEMGSTVKPLTVAMILESGTATPSKMYDAKSVLRIGRFSITDLHPVDRWISLADALLLSSNRVLARAVGEMGVPTHLSFLKALHLMDPLPLELGEVGRPQRPKEWREPNSLTMSYGYGLSITPLHLVAAWSSFLNDGTYHTPTFLATDPQNPPPGTRIFSPHVAQVMQKLLRLVVLEGTGRKAAAPGYVVGGKTGSANVISKGRKGYNKAETLSSFIGAFPMTNPKYVVLVMMDRPKATAKTFGFNTGGWTCAPAVRTIIERIAPLLGTYPQDEAGPAAQALLNVPGYTPGILKR